METGLKNKGTVVRNDIMRRRFHHVIEQTTGSMNAAENLLVAMMASPRETVITRLLTAKAKAKVLPEGSVLVPNTRRWIENRIDLIISTYPENRIEELGFADHYIKLVDKLVASA